MLASALLWFAECMLRMDGEVRGNLTALIAGTRPSRAWRAPLYRSRRIAAKSGIRAAACFLLAATFFAVSGWSTTEVSLSFVAIIIGLGATTPDPRAFTTIAVVAAPLASLMAGILEFVVLDGATAFPLLAIALAPFMIGAALLMTVPNRIVSALGRLNLVFILALLAPSNPQTYNPQTFLFSVLSSCSRPAFCSRRIFLFLRDRLTATASGCWRRRVGISATYCLSKTTSLPRRRRCFATRAGSRKFWSPAAVRQSITRPWKRRWLALTRLRPFALGQLELTRLMQGPCGRRSAPRTRRSAGGIPHP